jgi:hypothetical protein
MLLQHLAQHARDAGQAVEADGFNRHAWEKLDHAAQVRKSFPQERL